MAENEKNRKKSKNADPASDDNATVSSLISAGLADLHASGLLDDGAVVSQDEIPATTPIEEVTEEVALEWTMANQEIIDQELGTNEEAEHMLAAALDADTLSDSAQIGDAQMGEAQMADAQIDESSSEEVLSEEESAIADEELGPAEFIEADQVSSIIESLLFASDRPVSVGTIKQIFKGSNIRTKDITRVIDELASDYASSRRGVTLEEVNGGFQLRTKVDNADFLRRLSKSRPFRLSGPALETLSIIAYKQPLTKHEMDEIRGVESGHLVRALMERGLVNFAGKSELPGKPMLYQTTRKFLEIFGLRNLKELPTLSEIDELLPEGIGAEEEEKPKLADITGDLAQQVAGNTYSEGEEELDKINQSLEQIDTSSEFFEQEKIRQRDRRDAERAANIREALAVGEAVDVKDQRWLTRYEAKLAAPIISENEMDAQNASVADAGAATGDDATEGSNAELVADIESLSENLQADNRMSDEDSESEPETESDWDSFTVEDDFDNDDGEGQVGS